jgi:hypothetical protein
LRFYLLRKEVTILRQLKWTRVDTILLISLLGGGLGVMLVLHRVLKAIVYWTLVWGGYM